MMEQYPTKHYPTRTALSDPDAPILQRWRKDNAPRIKAWERANAQVGDLAPILSEDGIHIMPAGDLLGKAYLRDTHEQLIKQVCTHETKEKIEQIRARPWKDFVMMIRLSPEALMEHPAMKLACYPPLLREVAGYFGMWPRLADVCIHVNYPTETGASASQLWHRDPGDIKLCKVFVYLCDVTEENGPFCYIKGTQSFGRNSHIELERRPDSPVELEERLIRWTDEETLGAFPKDDYTICTGPLHTMIVADTVGLHRGLKPKSGGRVLVCFTYSSGIASPLYKLQTMPSWVKEECQLWALK